MNHKEYTTRAHESNNVELPKRIRKSSIEKAAELISKHRSDERKRSRDDAKILSDRKIVYRCKNFDDSKKRRTSTVGFSKSLALLEMQTYIARQDWKHASNLLPTFLEYPVELEPIVWRYIFIILMHSNDSSHLHRFLQQCVGGRGLNDGVLLERLLLLENELRNRVA